MKPRSRWDHPPSPVLVDSKTYRMCAGKIAYPSKKNASAKVRQLGGTLGAYKCPGCHRWHIGHSDRRTDRGAPT